MTGATTPRISAEEPLLSLLSADYYSTAGCAKPRTRTIAGGPEDAMLPLTAMEPALSRDELIAEATEIARQIRAGARPTSRGDLAWSGPDGYGTEQSPLVVTPFGADIFDGTTGIALFFASLARARDDGELRQLSLDTVAPLRRQLAALAADPERPALRLGAFKGVGSYVYGLVTLAMLLEEPSLVAAAHQATLLITPQRIARDRQLRVHTGCAGAILALLALHAEQPDANALGRRPLDLALDCARHLLDTRVAWDGRPRAWALSPGKPPLIGFGYGAAGICHALLRLHGETGESDLREAAREGLDFLRSLYSPTHGRWLDPRGVFEARHRLRAGSWTDWWGSGTPDDVEPRSAEDLRAAGPTAGQRFLRAWCHGSCGILLGKVATLQFDNSATVREEIQAGLDDLCHEAAGPATAGEADDLCCGVTGHAEALLYAHCRLGEPRYLMAAHGMVARAVRRQRRTGRYTLTAARGTHIFAPALLQGLAGVGYACLRLALPRDLPCVLLLE
jgi:lantibiotic modifying enzyme